MTDNAIAVRDESNTDVATTSEPLAVPANANTSALVLWAYEARQAARVAESLSKTSFVPQSLRGKAADITAAILAGQELGLKPMATLRSMDVIQGTPALRAHAMRGLVQSHGHKIWLAEQSDAKVVMRGQRRESDGSYGEVQEVTWTWERAQRLGLTTKDQWKKQPATMLTARATGEMARLVASDAIHAMPYVSEELRDEPELVTDMPAMTPLTAADLADDEPQEQAPLTADDLVEGEVEP